MAKVLVRSIIVFFFALSTKVMVEARYLLEIRAHTYQNNGHGDRGGNCCETLLSPPSCVLQCDNIFVFCLRIAGTTRDDNPRNCPLGSFNTSDDVPGGDDITFSSVNITSGVPNPMPFTGNAWPGQVQLYIEVVDEDTDGTANDPVDDIYVDISLSPSTTFSPVMPFNGDHGNGRIELSFRVQCETSFFGPNCTTFDHRTDDSTSANQPSPVNTDTNEANSAAIVGGGVGGGVGTIVLLMFIITVMAIIYVSTKRRKRNEKTPPVPPNTSFNHVHGADDFNTSPNGAYQANYNVFSSGTQPNVAYEAGAGMRLQGANNDEEAGTYSYPHTGGP